MRITPLDIQHKVFKKQFRGYHAQQVNEFLEEVAETLEMLIRENTSLREKMVANEAALAELRKTEAVLTNTLVTTQDFTEQLKREAQHEGKFIIKEAELKAEEMLLQSRKQLVEFQRNIKELRYDRVLMLEQIRSTLRTFERVLEIEEGEADHVESDEMVETPAESPPLSHI